MRSAWPRGHSKFATSFAEQRIRGLKWLQDIVNHPEAHQHVIADLAGRVRCARINHDVDE
eukprot:8632400-Pyramimonas_sp.AAC.1